MERPTIEVNKAKRLRICVEYVFRASFNDTYFLEEHTIDLNDLDKNQLTWFDPFCGRNEKNDLTVAVSYCSDNELIVWEKKNGEIKKLPKSRSYTACEDFDDSKMLAAHINISWS